MGMIASILGGGLIAWLARQAVDGGSGADLF